MNPHVHYSKKNHIFVKKKNRWHICQSFWEHGMTVHHVRHNRWDPRSFVHCLSQEGDVLIRISNTLSREYRVARNLYSRLLFTSEDRFAPICACRNNRWIWFNNASNLGSRDATDQLWWRQNSKSEKTALSENGEISYRWFVLAE